MRERDGWCCKRCGAENKKPHPVTGSIVVLTVAHLLPENYQAAKQALAGCVRLDECQSWADKMVALASYARQVNDRELEDFALRIRARAVRRSGEVLREIEPGMAGHPIIGAAADTNYLGRFAPARDSGLSRKQTVTALRVANVPEAEFEAKIESDKPPTGLPCRSARN